jgi:hypothetical protein
VLAGDELAAILVCMGALHVTFYVVPTRLAVPGDRAADGKTLVANAVVIAGGWVVYRVLLGAADLAPASI